MKDTQSGNGGLTSKHCRPCEKGSPPLAAERIKALLKQVPGWERHGGAISKTFAFKNYYETVAFVNAAAWVSHREDHHPDLEVGYNKCTVRYSTHSVGGLSENDFICAAKLEALFLI
jgi:4a-hydroxytetrahydrobiopterin dehydratase